MKQSVKTFFILPLVALSCSTLFSQALTDNQAAFITGNLSDKTMAVRQSSGLEAKDLSESGLDFIISYGPLLGFNRELSALAVASALAVPKDGANDPEFSRRITEKLTKTFEICEDENIRIAVIEKLGSLSVVAPSPSTVSLLNSFLSEKETAPASAVIDTAIVALGKTGNKESFKIIYRAWVSNRWSQYESHIEEALVSLSAQSMSEVITLIASAPLEETDRFFTLLANSQTISKNFISEIAENALLKTIHIAEDASGSKKDSIPLQLASLKVITENHWSKATQIVIRYFSLAREEYEKNIMAEEDFISVIKNIALLSSLDCSATLSSYLQDLNKSVSKGAIPAESVVLAVISALGDLGDKAAFDNLLYATYLSYPQTVIDAARDALQKLKW